MDSKIKTSMLTLGIVLPVLVGSCDDASTRIAREAADRQAQQNTIMAELNKEVAGGTRGLVAADAQARREIVTVHRDLQAERRRLDTNWDALDEERRQIAGQRRTESLLVPLAYYLGLAAVVTALFGFCWYAVAAANRGDTTDSELHELLVEAVLADHEGLFSHNAAGPALISSPAAVVPADEQ